MCRPDVPALWSRVAEKCSQSTSFAVIKQAEADLLARFQVSVSEMPKIIVFTAGKKHVYTGTADLHGIVAFVNRASGAPARAVQAGSDDWQELEGGGEVAELEADMRPHFLFRQQDGVQVMTAVSHI
jgi:hypothetical protein